MPGPPLTPDCDAASEEMDGVPPAPGPTVAAAGGRDSAAGPSVDGVDGDCGEGDRSADSGPDDWGMAGGRTNGGPIRTGGIGKSHSQRRWQIAQVHRPQPQMESRLASTIGAGRCRVPMTGAQFSAWPNDRPCVAHNNTTGTQMSPRVSSRRRMGRPRCVRNRFSHRIVAVHSFWESAETQDVPPTIETGRSSNRTTGVHDAHTCIQLSNGKLTRINKIRRTGRDPPV
jgi:hypothetical protein